MISHGKTLEIAASFTGSKIVLQVFTENMHADLGKLYPIIDSPATMHRWLGLGFTVIPVALQRILLPPSGVKEKEQAFIE